MKYTALLLCLCNILLFGSCKNHPSAHDGQPMEVMTFNIRLDIPSDSANSWNHRKDDVCRMIAYYRPDLLGMQEVLHNQMNDLKRGLPQYTVLGVGRDDGKEAGEYCPIFFRTDRFALVEYGNFSLSEHPETIGIKGWDASYNRIATWAILQEKDNGQQLIYLNTHLDNDGKTARQEGVRLILNKIKEIAPGIPAIVTGDFNCTPEEAPLQTLENGGMENASKAAAVPYGPSWSFHDFGRLPVEERVLIDYVFTTKGAKIDRYRVVHDKPDNGYLSDHCPILVELTVQ